MTSARGDRIAESRRYYLKNRDKILAKQKVYTLANHERILARGREYNRAHPESTNRSKYKRLKELRAELFAHYGNKCACPRCPEVNSDFYTIDHTTREGKLRDKGKTGLALYRHLKRLDYPPDIRLLCYNCNCARQHRGNGVCPHMFN